MLIDSQSHGLEFYPVSSCHSHGQNKKITCGLGFIRISNIANCVLLGIFFSLPGKCSRGKAKGRYQQGRSAILQQPHQRAPSPRSHSLCSNSIFPSVWFSWCMFSRIIYLKDSILSISIMLLLAYMRCRYSTFGDVIPLRPSSSLRG